jgi:hypothetical protein
MMRRVVLICAAFLPLLAGAQEKTINRKPSANTDAASLHKVLLVPFEPKLYFGEIDRSIHEETSMSAKDIRHRFRDGLNEQLYKAFKASGYQVLDLMEDTTKYRRDVEGIYQFLSYDYLRVPDQENYKVPQKEKPQQKVEKGQLNVETNSDLRFMNARLTNQKLVPQLTAKFRTNVYVFVNQLDIKASGSQDPGQLGTNPLRKVTVHYTVFTADGKEINSGIADEEFPADLNNPKKIVDRHFAAIAKTIVKRVNKGLGSSQ